MLHDEHSGEFLSPAYTLHVLMNLMPDPTACVFVQGWAHSGIATSTLSYLQHQISRHGGIISSMTLNEWL